MVLSVSSADGRFSLAGESSYSLNFGNLFQGRRSTIAGAARIEFQVNITGELGQAVNLQLSDTESRYDVVLSDDAVLPDKPLTVTVNVMDRAIGSPGIDNFGNEATFSLYFPGLETSYTFNVTWYNYWVITQINPPALAAGESAKFQKWLVSATTETGVIPAGERIEMEVLVDDVEQIPTALRILDSLGNYDRAAEDLAEIKGRRGVILAFDAANGELLPGAVASTIVCLRKSPGSQGTFSYLHFGEHSDKGVYAGNSDYLQIGSTGGKLDFSVFPDLVNAVSSDTDITVTWKIQKSIPAGSWDDDVSVRVGIPSNSGILEWKTLVLSKDVVEIDIVTKQYARNIFGQGDRTFTPSGDLVFNQDVVNFAALTPLVVSEIAEEIIIPNPEENPLLGTDSSVVVTSIQGSSISGDIQEDAAFFFGYDDTTSFYQGGGTVTITPVLVRYDTELTKVKTVQLFNPANVPNQVLYVKDKVDVNVPDNYQFYLFVRYSGIPGIPNTIEYHLRAATAYPKTPTLAMFGGDMKNIKILEYDNAFPILSETNIGLTVKYMPMTGKYLVSGTTTRGTNGQEPVGGLSEGTPKPATNIYFGNVLITPAGAIVLIYETSGVTYYDSELTPSGMESPTVDLRFVTTGQYESSITTELRATVLNGVAPQNIVIHAVITKRLNDGSREEFLISLRKGDNMSSVTMTAYKGPVTRKMAGFFDTAVLPGGYVQGKSPAFVLVPFSDLEFMPLE